MIQIFRKLFILKQYLTMINNYDFNNKTKEISDSDQKSNLNEKV